MIELAKENRPNFDQPESVQVISECALVFSHFNNETIVTKHNIANGKIGEGFPVSSETVLSEIEKHCKNSNNKPKLMPENILLDSSDNLVWYTKSKKRPMWFRVSKPISLNVKWPNLLFRLDRKKKALFVYALATSSRPTEKSKLYRAPVMNTDKDGRICLGSAHLPKDITSSNIGNIENCLFKSYFTHLNQASKEQGKVFETDQQHIKFWREKQKNNVAVKNNELPFFKTLSQVLGM